MVYGAFPLVNHRKATYLTCYVNVAQTIVNQDVQVGQTATGGAVTSHDNFVIHGPECCRRAGVTVTIGA